MIISMPPATGKTTCSKLKKDIIDLDIKAFSKDNKNRVRDYCSVAHYLSEQGYIVLVGTQLDVMKYFIENNVPNYFIVYFNKELKTYLIDKIYKRDIENKEKPLYYVYNSMKKTFEEEYNYIQTLNNKYIIEEENYNILEIITKLKKEKGK